MRAFQGLEPIRQHPMTAVESGCHCAHRTAQYTRHLFIGEIVEIAQQDHDSILRRQRRNGTPHRTGYLSAGVILFLRGWVRKRLQIAGDQRFGFTPLHRIHAGVYGQSIQPGGEIGIPTKSIQIRNYFQEDHLDDVASRRSIAMQEIKCDRINAVFIKIVERTKRFPVARPAGCNKLGAALAIDQINHRGFRRHVDRFSSIFIRRRPRSPIPTGNSQTAYTERCRVLSRPVHPKSKI